MIPRPLNLRRRGLWLASCCLLAAPAMGAVSFQDEIAALLEARCLQCHNPNNPKGDLSLSTLADAAKGGKEGPAIVPGDPHASPLLDRVASGDMPEEGAPLSEAEVSLLRRWIQEGAVWPEAVVLREKARADHSWWAYQPLRGEAPPAVEGAPEGWNASPIDRYVYRELKEGGLQPNGPAGRTDLIRRATYDLTGLPPTPEELAAFARDPSPDAWEKVVDRLLASPHYGERWGRHWLDVVRFGESRGFERNVITDNIWPFRDYVIRSLNADKPFDRFIVEHLAGDVVGAGDPEVEVATAFLVAGPFDDVGNQDVRQQAIIRANTLDDVISATGSAFLAMTVNCARCHDHKFDPVLQKDYYRLRAAFEGVQQKERVLATAEEKQAHREKTEPLQARIEELKTRRDILRQAVIARGRSAPGDHLPATTRRKVDRAFTEDVFAPVIARFVRLVPLTTDRAPAGPGSIRIDEFEVWTAESEPRNVALATNGGIARADSREVRDSADNAANAYGPLHVNDGRFGKRWISSGDHTLTVEFAKPERIGRAVFSSDRHGDLPDNSVAIFAGEYRLEASLDGETWQTVAESWDREPLSEAFLEHRLLRFAAEEAETAELAQMEADIRRATAELARIPPLPTVWAGQFEKPPVTHLARGGDPNQPAEAVLPASLSTLSPSVPPFELAEDAEESKRRLALAEWMVHPDNPLTPRVLANRVWHYHFGTGIVDTPSDFGYMGGRPSHPELLDYLARRLLDHGWRLKPLHREILLSQAYPQSGEFREDAAAVDSEARLLWRFPPRRLSAEEIRDTILSLSGKLNLTMGGPGFRLYEFTQDNVCTYHPLDEHGPDTWRRAVYHQTPRAAKMDLLTEFDCPDPAFSAPDRAATTTPLQALTMMNHSFTLQMSAILAERLAAEASGPEEQVRRAFELAYGRRPEPEEIKAAAGLVREHGLETFCRALINSNELIYVK